MNKNKIIVGMGMTAFLGISSFIFYSKSAPRNLNDEALLAIIKNDQEVFNKFIASGGDIHAKLPAIEGKTYSILEGIVYFQRARFLEHLISKNMMPQDLKLLHLASAECSHKMIPVLHKAGLKWDARADDGANALTIAASNGCLQALSYWKENGADFKAKDGQGLSALSILNKQKDAALAAFAQSFAPARLPASATNVAAAVPNFYNKRVIPKDNLADRAHLIEPEDRPEDSHETAEYSEFSD